MLFSRISQTSASYISQEINLDQEKEEIVAYAIETMLLGVVGFILIILMGIMLDAALTAAVAAISGGLLRRLSGGAHFDTPYKCLAFGAVVYGLLGYLTKIIIINYDFNLIYNTPLLVASLAIVAIYAPVESLAKPIHSIHLKNKLRLSAIGFTLLIFGLIFIINYSLVSQALVLGVAYQSITLLPMFNK